MNTDDDVSQSTISRTLGTELRRARERLGLSRQQLVAKLPSGICDRTLMSYEHGTRQVTALRLLELCHALEESTPDLLRRALQTAATYLENLELHVNLHAVINDKNMRFRPMVQWARNSLNDSPSGIMAVTPSAVRNLAAIVGCARDEMAAYLAKFSPEPAETDQTA